MPETELKKVEDRLATYQEWLRDKRADFENENGEDVLNPYEESYQKLLALGDPIRVWM